MQEATVRSSVRRAASEGTERTSSPAGSETGVPQLVLLVDPDKDSRLMYGAILRHDGFRVVEATQGVEGIRMAREHHPDLILTELFVATAQGWKVPELLRDDPRTADIPVIALTTYARSTDGEAAYASGCVAFLAKPCEPTRVLEEVHRWIGAARRGA